jgi:hypothetical protein
MRVFLLLGSSDGSRSPHHQPPCRANPDGVLLVILEALGGERKEEDPYPNPLPQTGEGEG